MKEIALLFVFAVAFMAVAILVTTKIRSQKTCALICFKTID